MKTLQRLIRPVLWSAAAIALVIALAACGDAPNDAPDAAQPTAVPVATATAVPPTIAAPQATATAAPAPTVAPAPRQAAVETPTSVPTSAEVERLSVKGMELLTRFTEDYSPRESGTDGERAAAEFIKGYLEDLGYDVEFQAVDDEHLPWDAEFISLIGDGRPELRGVPLSRTAYGDVTGPLVSVGKAFEEDIPEDGLEGAIALIERGEITFEEKVNRVAKAGAVAAIIYNNERGQLPRRAAIGRARFPPRPCRKSKGGKRCDCLRMSRKLEARVKIETALLDSQNVIAELDGQVEKCGVVVMGRAL